MKPALFVGIALLIAPNAPAENLYSATGGNILQFTPDGSQSTFVSGVGASGQLAFDNSGNLYMASPWNGTIYQFTPAGQQNTFASGLNFPVGVAVDSAGNVFVADMHANTIYRYAPGGAQSIFASGLNGPQSLAFNGAGDLFVADVFSGNIYEYTPGGAQSTFASGVNGYRITTDSAGNVYVGDIFPSGTTIIKISPGGVASPFASYSGYNVYAMACDNDGDLFTANGPAPNDYGYNGKIIEIAPDGTQTIFAYPLDYTHGLAFLPLPEPASCGLLSLGALLFFGGRCRRNLPSRSRSRCFGGDVKPSVFRPDEIFANDSISQK